MASAPDGADAQALCSDLVDLQHQLDVLSNKVDEQQAYVLIFGPLKSGKSTLMNAIAASYVSEVSSLPAYPCMVFVSHAAHREFTVTYYNGKTRVFGDPAALKEHVDEAHRDLAQHIRAAEADSAEFDPQLSFPAAIRRIDVRVPAGDLGNSHAVLVDTPGLYSRMKFGYDQMTRDFRNAAACAVFVVRSDNLFLEQVFAEFNRLLELFSRIFLVVNIDSCKVDLGPNGELVPSLEQQDPNRIIEAFESLSMSAPLKAAAEEGRLRIYPVDLLRAASTRVRAAGGKDSGGSESTTASPSHFELFHKDLTDYLNSTDHLVSFLGDSMRHATGLLTEVRELCDGDAVSKVEAQLEQLDVEHKLIDTRLEAVERLARCSWAEAFDRLHADLVPIVERLSDDVGERTSRAIREQIDGWFKNDDSLEALVKGGLVPQFTRYQEELTAAVSRELSERVVVGKAGIEIDADVADALGVADVDLDAIGRRAHTNTDRAALIAVPPTPLRSDHLSVRRSPVDWMLLRNKPSIRRRLFGAPDQPSARVPREEKQARLGETARREIRRRLDDYRREFFTDTTERLRNGFLGSYARAAIDEIIAAVRTRRAELEKRAAEIESRRGRLRLLIEPLADLRRQAKTASQAMDRLASHYGEVDLFLLTQPVSPSYTIPGAKPAAAATKDGGAKAPSDGSGAVVKPAAKKPAATPAKQPAKPAPKSDSDERPATPNGARKTAER